MTISARLEQMVEGSSAWATLGMADTGLEGAGGRSLGLVVIGPSAKCWPLIGHYIPVQLGVAVLVLVLDDGATEAGLL